MNHRTPRREPRRSRLRTIRQFGVSPGVLGKVRAFWHDASGVVLPYVTIILIVLLGISLLALDGARFMALHTKLQSRADALALAAAAELDRGPSAIDRALHAVDTFGQLSAENIKVANVRFLSSLPFQDSDPILPTNVTIDPTRAAYVEVTLQPTTMPTVLPASLFGGANVVSTNAQAVAGFDQVVCNSSPLYVCNPFEQSGMSYAQAAAALFDADKDPSMKRKLIRLTRPQPTSVGLTAGNFGYVTPATGSLPVDSCGPPNGNGLGQALAASRPPICLRLSRVGFAAGDDQVAMAGLNTRFDIYKSGFESCKANYVADVNVRKGYLAPGNLNWCYAGPSNSAWPISDPAAAGLPLDRNMIKQLPSGSQTVDTGIAIGNGVWDCATYWHLAHYVGPGAGTPPSGCTTQATISRYSVYQYEMQHITDRSQGGETGDAKCNPLGMKYRRVVTAAIINCGSNPDLTSNTASNVSIAAFGKFFLTLPSPSGATLYAEFLGLIKQGDPNSHDTVQLYR